MKAKKNPKFLEELSAEEDQKGADLDEVLWAVRECLNENGSMNSLKEIRSWLKEKHHINIKPWKLRNIMFAKMKLRYKRIEPISWQGNSPKNLVLRQHFAMTFLKQDLTKKTIVNIDETWLGMSNFKRMRWAPIGKANSMPKKNLQPRISMIVGLDTNGQVYTALLQANSNSSIMELFFTHFIRLMNGKDRYWRQNTILLLDGAPYHTSKQMLEFYEEHQLPIMFTAPHSYAASPVELFFAHFKRADINPAQLPLGKK